jgi:hypothetical protein
MFWILLFTLILVLLAVYRKKLGFYLDTYKIVKEMGTFVAENNKPTFSIEEEGDYSIFNYIRNGKSYILYIPKETDFNRIGRKLIGITFDNKQKNIPVEENYPLLVKPELLGFKTIITSEANGDDIRVVEFD